MKVITNYYRKRAILLFARSAEKESNSMLIAFQKKQSKASSYTHIGNIDLASLDLNDEADKWLFHVVQPWIELNEKYFGVKGFFPFDRSTLGIVTHPEYVTFYESISIKMTHKKNDALEIQLDKPFKNFLEVSYSFKTNKKVKHTRRALHGFEEKILESLSAAK